MNGRGIRGGSKLFALALGFCALLAVVAAWLVRGEQGRAAEAAALERSSRGAATRPVDVDRALPGVARAPFAASRRDEAADESDQNEADDATPLPGALRRVDVEIVYDDGEPLAEVDVAARYTDSGPETDNGVDPSSSMRPTRLGAKTDRRGRAKFVVAREAAFVVEGDGGERHPPFRTATVPPKVERAKLTLAAHALSVRAVDMRGAAVAGLTLRASGQGAGRGGNAQLATDAEGVAVFRGFDAGPVGVEAQVEDLAASPRHEAFVMKQVDGAVLENPDRLEARAPSSVRIVMAELPTATVRVVDPDGAPVGGATVSTSYGVAGHAGRFYLDTAFTGEDGRAWFALPRDGVTLAEDAVITEVRFDATAPNGLGPATLSRPGPAGAERLDAGDLVVPKTERLRFTIVDAGGAPIEGAVVFPLRADGERDEAREAEAADANGVVAFPGKPDDRDFVVEARRFAAKRFVVEAAARVAEGAGQTVALDHGATLTFRIVDDSKNARWCLLSAERPFMSVASGFADVDGRNAQIPLEAPETVLEGVCPDVALHASFGDDDGVFAAAEIAPLRAGEVRRVAVPASPSSARLVVHVIVERGETEPFQEISVLREGSESGVRSTGVDARGVALFEHVRCGGVVVVEPASNTRVRCEVAAPETHVELRPRPRRTVELRVFDAVGASVEPADVGAYDGDGRGYDVEFDRDEQSDGSVVHVERARVPGDTVVVFRVRHGGATYEAAAPPGKDQVELRLKAIGAVRIRVRPGAVRLNVVASATPVEGGNPVVSTTFVVTARAAESPEARLELTTGRYRVSIARWGGAGEEALEIVREEVVEVRAGKEATLYVEL